MVPHFLNWLVTSRKSLIEFGTDLQKVVFCSIKKHDFTKKIFTKEKNWIGPIETSLFFKVTLQKDILKRSYLLLKYQNFQFLT